jgi:hypothetical protein
VGKVGAEKAKRGTRPSAPRDQRTASAYIFGAICPANGKGAGLVLPSCNSEAMPCISRKFRSRLRQERMRFGMSRRSCRCPAI